MSADLVPTKNMINVDTFTVDDLLDKVDYSFPGYTPSIDALNFMNFIRLVYGEEPENKSPLMHYFLMDIIFRNVNPFEYYNISSDIAMDNFIAVMMHREAAKSVLLGSMLPLYMAYYGEVPGFGKVNFGGYIGNSVRGGVRQNMRTIRSVYEDSEFLQDKFEETHFTDTDVRFIRHARKNKDGSIKKVDRNKGKRTFVLDGYGAQTGPRGSRSGLTRPQFFIIDDVIKTEAESRSDVILGNINSMIDSDVIYALHGSNSFCIFIGTPFNLRDPLMNALISGSWSPVVFPIAETISLDTTEESFHGSWEDRHNYKVVMNKYKRAIHNGTLTNFMQEQMLRVASEENRMIKDGMINWFSREDVIKNGHLYNWYITTDFTTTGSKSSDFSAMGVWAVNNNGDFMLIDLVIKKLELATQYDTLMELVRKYKKMRGYIEVGVETSGQQKAHIFALKLLMAKHNEYFTIAIQKGKSTEGIMRSKEQGNKFEYFLLMVPAFQNSKMWFANEIKESADMQELLAELSYITHLGIGSRRDDGIDIISQLSQMNIRIPAHENPALPQHTKNFDGHYWEAEIVEENEGSSYIF